MVPPQPLAQTLVLLPLCKVCGPGEPWIGAKVMSLGVPRGRAVLGAEPRGLREEPVCVTPLLALMRPHVGKQGGTPALHSHRGVPRGAHCLWSLE